MNLPPQDRLLDMIRARQDQHRRIRDGENPRMSEWRKQWQQQILAEHGIKEPVATLPLTADEWQEFKRLFVESIGGEAVFEDTGMTHREFLEYLKSGWRENSQYDAQKGVRKRLRDWLREQD